ncbi:glycerophosphoryl diester phosphodiesterase [Cutibacterium sp.]|uniref:glycerophosphoryl diester phosphodiesterase n=1 Tax=Cutibacterium sp. TaxID=1912221 RepID=UPI0026DDA8B4|nr:glycerophosphoryl diester phosphodiesterase [Cutibacterium sp.]MDO4412897.1 glycerophosphoryl diester phosphodiesterase [Cutibacterium sp.]
MGKRIFAHRGLNRRAPENTMAAFRKAVDAGVTWIETDVDVLQDGTVIICHDTTLDRTTNCTGSYYKLNRADLAFIDAGSWFSPAYAGEPLPTLFQLVDYMNETGLNANIEIKSNEAGAAMTRQLISAVAHELRRLHGPQVIVSSFNHVLLHEFHALAPDIPLGCLYETAALYEDWRSILELVGATYIHPEDRDLTRERVAAFRDAGFGVNVWTVNSVARAHELFNWGVEGVFTDCADEMLHLAE